MSMGWSSTLNSQGPRSVEVCPVPWGYFPSSWLNGAESMEKNSMAGVQGPTLQEHAISFVSIALVRTQSYGHSHWKKEKKKKKGGGAGEGNGVPAEQLLSFQSQLGNVGKRT